MRKRWKEKKRNKKNKRLRWNEIEYICLISNKYGEPGVVIEIIDALLALRLDLYTSIICCIYYVKLAEAISELLLILRTVTSGTKQMKEKKNIVQRNVRLCISVLHTAFIRLLSFAVILRDNFGFLHIWYVQR